MSHISDRVLQYGVRILKPSSLLLSPSAQQLLHDLINHAILFRNAEHTNACGSRSRSLLEAKKMEKIAYGHQWRSAWHSACTVAQRMYVGVAPPSFPSPLPQSAERHRLPSPPLTRWRRWRERCMSCHSWSTRRWNIPILPCPKWIRYNPPLLAHYHSNQHIYHIGQLFQRRVLAEKRSV